MMLRALLNLLWMEMSEKIRDLFECEMTTIAEKMTLLPEPALKMLHDCS